MEALFFKFSKRVNSTARPSDATGYLTNVSIRQNFTNKEGDRSSAVCSPTLFIEDVNNNFDTSYNYMKMGGRYYFIRDIDRTIDKAARLNCEIDALATLKEDILNTKAFVLYSASDYNNDIDDVRNHDTIPTQQSSVPFGFPFSVDTSGTYILTVKGGNGVATTYGLTNSQLLSIANEINGTLGEATQSAWQSATSIWRQTDPSKTDQENANIIMEGWGEFFGHIGDKVTDNYLQFLADVKNSIVSLRWTPISAGSYTSGGSSSAISLGSYATLVIGTDITKLIKGSSTSITIPILGTGYTRGDRFSSYGIYLPFSGAYQLSADDVVGHNSCEVYVNIGCANGDIIYRVVNSSGKRICTASGNCASDTFLSTNNQQGAFVSSLSSALKLGISTGTAIASGGLSATIGIVGAATSSIGMIAPQQLSGGGSISTAVGYFAGNLIEAYCSMRSSSGLIGTDAYNIVGGPLFAVRTLGSLSGYCQCQNASVESSDLTEILYIANRQINNGFFIE